MAAVSPPPRTPPPYTAALRALPRLLRPHPGSHGLRGLDAWLGGSPIHGVKDIGTMFALIAAIALGMLTAATLAPSTRNDPRPQDWLRPPTNRERTAIGTTRPLRADFLPAGPAAGAQ